MKLKQFLSDLVNQELEGSSLFLLDIKLKGNAEEPRFHVFIDGDQGVKVEDCAKLNRFLNAKLEEKLGDVGFSMEVSSPGADKDLLTFRQYNKLIGKFLKIETLESGTFEGKLLSKTDEDIVIEEEIGKKKEKKERVIAFNTIKKANVIIKF